jgi:hypothetical protein
MLKLTLRSYKEKMKHMFNLEKKIAVKIVYVNQYIY